MAAVTETSPPTATAPLDRLDVGTILSDLKGLPDTEFDKALGKILKVWLAKDPAQAARLLQHFKDVRMRFKMVQEVAGAWARKDLRAARQWAESINDTGPATRAWAFGGVLHEWAKSDLASASRYAESLADQRDRGFATMGLAEGYAEKDPAGAARLALSLPGGFERTSWLRAAAKAWGKANPQEAMNWALSVQDSDTESALLHVTAGIGEANPSRIPELLDSWGQKYGDSLERPIGPSDGSKWELLSFLPPKEALEWLANQPSDTPGRETLILQTLNRFEDRYEADRMACLIFWGKQPAHGPLAAIAWWWSHMVGDNLYDDKIVTAGEVPPERVIEWAETQVPTRESDWSWRARYFSEVMHGDAQEAEKLRASISPKTWDATLEAVAGGLAKSDRARAVAWLKLLPQSPKRDQELAKLQGN